MSENQTALMHQYEELRKATSHYLNVSGLAKSYQGVEFAFRKQQAYRAMVAASIKTDKLVSELPK